MTILPATNPFPSPVGPLWLAGNDRGLTRLSWTPLATAPFPALLPAQAWLADYFRGHLRPPDFPLDPAGTPWQQQVWQALLAIPPGCTETYGDLSRHIGGSPRAVGRANAANPIPVIIPCHRVVARQGTGGYSGAGGVATKSWLLKWEAEHTHPPGG